MDAGDVTGNTIANGARIGIDLGGTKIEGVVLDAAGSPVYRRRVPTERERGYEHIVERVAILARDLCRRAPACCRIGIGTPGSLSEDDAAVKNSNTTCLNGRPLRLDLTRRIGMDITLENDANCFALAEAEAGAGRGHELTFGVILGTGVGGGLIWRGQVWRGPQHIAGEWGHHCVDPAGPRCYCGRRGCAETLLSGPALERAYRAASGSPCPAEEIAARAQSGDEMASAVLDRYMGHFGRALGNVINIIDPSIVVLGGGLSNLELLYTRGIRAVEGNVFNAGLRTPVVRNHLGDSAGVIGAALLSAA